MKSICFTTTYQTLHYLGSTNIIACHLLLAHCDLTVSFPLLLACLSPYLHSGVSLTGTCSMKTSLMILINVATHPNSTISPRLFFHSTHQNKKKLICLFILCCPTSSNPPELWDPISNQQPYGYLN